MSGTIKRVATIPPLSRTPYRQAVMEVLLENVTSPDGTVAGEVVVHGLAVDDRVPTAMAKWRVGQELQLEVVPWRAVEERFGRLHRFALEDPDFELIEAPRYWIK